MRGGQEEKKPQKMVRSSIACARCRRSKVKCVNNGVNSVCKACAQSNRECTYPVAGSTPAPKRPEAPTGVKQEDGGENKKRVRRVEDSGRRNSQRLGEDPLESPILTKKVWDELYDIFKLHFSTEMPFLHPPTFRHRMKQAAFPRDPTISLAGFEDAKVLLLGVLTLTARFHPALVAHYSPHQGDPIAASEYYANTLAASFGPTIRSLANPSLESVQALLMLGLYEWGQTRGLSAWLYVGTAVRLAQSIGLAYEDDPDNPPLAAQNLLKANGHTAEATEREVLTEREVRRRTLWSCFIMDRMLAAGKYRPTMMNVDRLRVQLPCSDEKFLFVRDVKTGFLNSDWLDESVHKRESETVNDDGALSRFIRLVEIFGRLSEWSYAGGRRTEKLPPWDPSTEFYKLRKQLEEFHDALPSNLALTESNLSAHIETRNATTYASMHTLYCLCLIMLHREYIPFIPIRCEKPMGPLDEPTFPEKDFKIPSRFWEDSAERIMKASRDIIDIVRTCQDHDALPESPQFGFAVWSASFVCIYAAYFPQMDMGYHLVSQEMRRGGGDRRNKGNPLLTRKILTDMAPRLKMVKGYLKTVDKMHDYFSKVLHDFVNKFGKGGGLEQYKVLEKELNEFGDLKDTDHHIPSPGSDTVDQNRSRASTNDIGGSSVNDESMPSVEGASAPRQNGTVGTAQWAAVNASSPPVELEDRAKHNTFSQYPYGMPPYQQSPNQSSNAPSLISTSNGDSNSGLNSPFTSHQGQQPYHTQPQHAASYPSIAQHSMAPPNPQMTYQILPEQEFHTWAKGKENISMNTGFDNFGQEFPIESYPMYPGPNQTPNYIQALWGVPQAVVETGWSS